MIQVQVIHESKNRGKPFYVLINHPVYNILAPVFLSCKDIPTKTRYEAFSTTFDGSTSYFFNIICYSIHGCSLNDLHMTNIQQAKSIPNSGDIVKEILMMVDLGIFGFVDHLAVIILFYYDCISLIVLEIVKKLLAIVLTYNYNIKYQCFSTNDRIKNKMNEQRKAIILAHYLNYSIGNANIVCSFIITIISNLYFTINRNDLILDDMESNGLLIFFSFLATQ